MKMAIIGMPRKTLAKATKSTITIKQEMLVRRRNMARCRQDFNSDEFDESNDEQFKPKKKGAKVRFDTYRRGVYC